MKKAFDQVSNHIKDLNFNELSMYLRETGARKFYARVCAIASLYTTGLYKEKYNSVQEWAEEEFGWNRKQVERYRDAYFTLLNLDGASNWTHLPVNELQCRTLASFDFDTKELKEAWSIIDRAVCEGARLTGKLIEEVCSAKIDTLRLEEPGQYEAVMRQISPGEAEISGDSLLGYRPDVPFCPNLLDWKENANPHLPEYIPEGKVMVVNVRGFENFCEWAAERMDLDFLIIADFPVEYEEKEMPPNVWPGIIATSRDDFEKALQIFSNTWSQKKWLWVNLREPVFDIRINAEWVVVREVFDPGSLGEILRDTQDIYILPGSVEKFNRIPEKSFEITKVIS